METLESLNATHEPLADTNEHNLRGGDATVFVNSAM